MKRLSLVIATTALLLSACGSSGSKSAAPADSTVDVALTDYMIMPMALTAKAGTVKFHVHNDGKAPHNFTIANPTKVGASKDLNPGQSEDVTVDLKAGSYETSCTEPGHASLGMKGTLTVS